MGEPLKKISDSGPRPVSEDEVQFAEEVRLPLSNEDRDSFLKALEADTEPTEAAKKAAMRYRESGGDGRCLYSRDAVLRPIRL